jgi:TRAP-type C4-dicarboxylate transport system substrate-binding protein
MPSTAPLRLHFAGYSPPRSTHGKALDRIAHELRERSENGVEIEIDYNVMDHGRPAQSLLADVESGRTTLCFFSTSYLVERVPEMGIVDLPFAFSSLGDAHAALDGALGDALSDRTRQATELVPLGYWDNGFRHISNRSREVRRPDDCRGLKMRLQPNWIHEEFFRALGAEPVCTDLSDGIAMLKAGELDAQENPLANLVAYGLEEVHPHVSLTGHVYGARGVYASARQLEGWPDEARQVLAEAVRAAIAQQREEAERAELELRESLTQRGLAILELNEEERAAFRSVAAPVLAEARKQFDDGLWNLLGAR